MKAGPCLRRTKVALHHRLRRFAAGLPICLSPLLILPAGCHPGDPPARPRSGASHAEGQGDAAGVLKARSLRVQDGDSFVARLADGSSRTIRLSGIDAPERGQPHGDDSLQNLRRLLENRDLQVQVAKTDAYGRAVAQVFVGAEGGPVDVGLAQVRSGMAWFYRRYRQDLPAGAGERYADAEKNARDSRRGLWHADDPQPPWEFRRRHEGEDRPVRR
jgi:micrococcal nuclease